MAKNKSITGINLGSSGITAVIAEINDEGEVDILGTGEADSKGIRRGVIVNIDAVAGALQQAVEKAEIMAGVEVENVVVGIAGDHIEGINSKGVIGVTSKTKEITPFEVDRVMESASSVRLPAEREIIHVIPQEFKVDEQDGIKDPVGMAGTRLEVEVHIITGALTSINNLIKVIKKSGLNLEDLIVVPVASAEAVLNEEEKDMGVALVDIGKSTTSVVIYIEGAIWHTAILPIGGEHVTNDIAMGLKMHPNAAEETKINYGSAFPNMVGDEEVIEIPSVGGRAPRTIPKKALAEIIGPRMEEIFNFVTKEFDKAGCREILTAGLVITGGGARLEGTAEVAELVCDNMAARIGYPKGFTGIVDIENKPQYAAPAGLILSKANEENYSKGSVRNTGGRASMLDKLKDWFGEFF